MIIKYINLLNNNVDPSRSYDSKASSICVFCYTHFFYTQYLLQVILKSLKEGTIMNRQYNTRMLSEGVLLR